MGYEQPVGETAYETGTGAAVRAVHVMPGLPPPEGERHAHDYRLDVVVRRHDLDERGMVVDLDVLDAALRDTAGAVDGGDLDQIVGVAGSGDGVTVERFARWVHDRLAAALAPLPGAVLSVRVWESPMAFGGYVAPLDGTGRPTS